MIPLASSRHEYLAHAFFFSRSLCTIRSRTAGGPPRYTVNSVKKPLTGKRAGAKLGGGGGAEKWDAGETRNACFSAKLPN